MADFTLNAPGTTNNPWNPANIIIPSGALQTDATLGIRNASGSVHVVFAHDEDYGDEITASITLSQWSNFDEILVGAAVRTGSLAGAIVGLALLSEDGAQFRRVSEAGSATTIGIGITPSANFTAGDVVEVIYNKTTGAITATQNGNAIGTGETDSTYAGEASLAAGAYMYPGNSNSSYISKFEGIGVAGSGGAATQLEFGNQPQNTVVGQTMVAVTVRATDSEGLTDATYTGNVTVALQTGSGTLAGTLTKAAVAGVATFNDLSINTLNTNAVLRATASGLTLDDSATFNITAGSGGGSVAGSLIGSALVS